VSPTRLREYPGGAKSEGAQGDPRPPVRQGAMATEVPPEPDDPAIGTQVGDWTITRRIGKGGMGAVYQARHSTTQVPVAIKVLLPPDDPEADDEARQRFANEAQAPTLIGVHPNIIQVFTFGIMKDGPWSGRPWFAMEFLQGRSLEQKLAVGPPPPIEEMRRLLSQICDALATIHDKRVVHRDLKPANIFIAEPKHGDSVAKLLDFGIAKIPSNAMTQMGACLGTWKYAAPEQLSPNQLARHVDIDASAAAGPETDIFGMGAVLFEVFTGTAPYGFAFVDMPDDFSTRDGYPKITPTLEKLIRDCLQRRKENRPSSIKEVKRRLIDALTEMAVRAPTVPPPLVTAPAGTASSSASVFRSRVGSGFGTSAGGRTNVVGAAADILFGPRRRVYWALGGALVLGLAAGFFAVWGRHGGNGASPRAVATEPSAPPRTAAPPPAPIPAVAPVAAVRAPEPATRAAHRTPRPGPQPASAGRPSSSLSPEPSALQPGPPPAVPAPAPAPTADRGQPAPSPAATLPSAPASVAPARPAGRSSRPLTPSERDMITDQDTLFK